MQKEVIQSEIASMVIAELQKIASSDRSKVKRYSTRRQRKLKTNKEYQNQIFNLKMAVSNQMDKKTTDSFEKIDAKVIDIKDSYYIMREQGSMRKFTVPFSIMHKFVVFPSQMSDTNKLLIAGEIIKMVKKTSVLSGRIYYYPDHSFYEHKVDDTSVDQVAAEDNQQSTIESFLETLRGLGPNVFSQFVSLASNLKADSNKGDTKADYVSLPEENQHVEYKSSLYYPAEKTTVERTAQLRVIIREMVGFANADEKGSIYIGVKDDRTVNGVEDEIGLFAPNNTKEKFAAMFNNLVRQTTTGNLAFNYDMEWLTIEGHTVCKITVKTWNHDVILFGGNQLYIRKGCENVQLKNEDLLNYIRLNKYNHQF